MKRNTTTKKRKKKPNQSSLFQRTLIMVTCAALALCAASVTYGLFFRHSGGSPGEESMFMIKILNGTGEKGLANKASDRLRDMGIDVVEVGNANDFSYDASVLIARNKNPQIETLGKLLNCSNIIEQLKDDELVDAVLILGADYKKLNIGL
jgi:hypothetical protein